MKILFTLILTGLIASFVFGQEIINAGFESGSLEGWTQTQGTGGGVSSVSHSGSYSLQIDSRGTVEQIVEGLEKGTDYILRVYVKCGPGGRANPGAKDYGRSKTAAISTDTSWVLVEKSFRTGLESTSATIYVTNLRTNSFILADDFSLVRDTHSAFESSLPDPPDGFHWEKIEHLSDEFNGESLDRTKWLDHHPYWSGREPSKHNPANVFVADGYLGLENTSRVDDLSEVADPTKDVWVDAACVTSRNRNVSYGYYEARIKESLISMTSAFWFQGKYSEIDVIENLGAPSNNNGNEKSMHSNTHYYPDGWANDLKTPRSWLMPYPAGEDFHIYGLWWIDERHINIYHNGQLVHEIELPGDYDEPMYMFFDTEVFTWEGLPSIESLNNPEINTMYVDWVRSWELVPGTRVEKKTNEPKDFRLYQNYPNPFNPGTTIEYSLDRESQITLSIFDAAGRFVRTLANGQYSAGQYSAVWDGRNDSGELAASGVYFYKLQAGDFSTTRKMILMR